MDIHTVGLDGRQREMLCIPLRRYPKWLNTINPAKVQNPAVHQPYAEGIGATYEIVERLIAGDAEAVQMHTLAKGAKPGNPRIAEQPRDERGRVLPKVDPASADRIDNNVNNTEATGRSSPVGNTAEAGIRRLTKEAAAGNTIAAQALAAVKARTKSVHRAMVECGLRKGVDLEARAAAADRAAKAIVALGGDEAALPDRDERKMLVELHGEGGLPKFGETYRDHQNDQAYPAFRPPKREAMVLVRSRLRDQEASAP